MNRTATFGSPTLGRCAIALCSGLTLTALGCVGSIGGSDSGASQNPTAREGSSEGDEDTERRIGLGSGGAPDTGGAPADTGGAPADTGGAGGVPSAGSAGSAGSTQCVYPASDGEWTPEVGSTLPQSLQWHGFAEHSSTESTITIEDYLDCDGSRGIHAILLETSAIWCGSCQYHASMLTEKLASSWTAKGIRVLTLMIQDRSGNPADVENALAWKNAFELDSSATVADPDFTFAPPSGYVALPLMVVVDPRTMQITAIPEHAQQVDVLVEQLAALNAGR